MSDDKMTVPERRDIPVGMTWDLSRMYKTDAEWEADFGRVDSLLENFMRHQGTLGAASANLAAAFAAGDELDRLLEKLYVFAHLRSDEDTSDNANRGRLDRIAAKAAEIEGETSWFEPEILGLDEELLKKYMGLPELAFYWRSLRELLRSKPHTLSAEVERVLGLASDLFSGPEKIFSLLSNADMRFPKVEGEDGKKIELTHGNYLKFLESHNREVRKNAFHAMYDTYDKFKNTYAATLDSEIKTHVYEAKVRNYNSALQASLHCDNLSVEIFDGLIDAVNGSLPRLHRYFDLRRKVLGLEALDMYDLYNPLVPECRMEISWEEAVKTVTEALRPLGDEYVETMKKAFTERWIDVRECRGKRSGAYSSGCYDSPPYILMNFNGSLNDMFTLAHELGHSMHSHYSNKTQPYHYADYRIFVAEVASITNELLLHDHLMRNTTDKKVRLHLLTHLADETRGTVFRQTMFSEFEKAIHQMSEESEPLTADSLCDLYQGLNSKYHGPPVRADKRIRLEWARIPHFYYDFYVYKYATGFSSAVMLSKNILSFEKRALDAYFEFLRAGDSKDVLDIMADAGVDLRSPKPVHAALEHFENVVGRLEDLTL